MSASVSLIPLQKGALNAHCREASKGVCTASSVCKDAQTKVISVCNPGEVDIIAVNDQIHKGMYTQAKKSCSAGFYVYLATRAALCQASPQHDYDKKQSGGFRDVGNHTTSERLPTCWPLVEQVFHFLAQVCIVTPGINDSSRAHALHSCLMWTTTVYLRDGPHESFHAINGVLYAGFHCGLTRHAGGFSRNPGTCIGYVSSQRRRYARH